MYLNEHLTMVCTRLILVGTLCTVLSSVYLGTCLPIFIEIGSYLTNTEQKKSWHVFTETRCTLYMYKNHIK